MNSTRRSVIVRGAALVATNVLAGSGPFAPSRVRAQPAAGLPMPNVKALVFDTFGTVVWCCARSGANSKANGL